MHSTGDTGVNGLVSECELAWFLMCTRLAGDTEVTGLVSACELAWFSMCTVLVTLTVAFVISDGELAWV